METASPEAKWGLYLLGRAELRNSEGKPVRLPTKKCLLLLVVLANADEGQMGRDELATIIWPEASPKAGRDSLRNALAVLKRTLPADAIRANDEAVHLARHLFEIHAIENLSHRDYDGDFMPGFSQDWVLDRRLALRTAAAECALDEALRNWNEGRRKQALDLARRAVEIDPLNSYIAAERVRLLEASGKPIEAIAASDGHRVRVLREFGIVAERIPVPMVEEQSPMLAAAEWLLERNPEEALSMFAATPMQWLNLSVMPVLKLHERALNLSKTDTLERRMVAAQHAYLCVLAGSVRDDMAEHEQAFDKARQAGEPAVAARLAQALSYGYLSKGNFARSLQFAKRSVECARQTGKPTVEVDSMQNLGVIYEHVGYPDRGWQTLQEVSHQVDELGSPQIMASQYLVSVEYMLAEGKIDQVASNVEKARRIFEASGSRRQDCWVLYAEALLHIAIGENYRAKEMLETIGSMPNSHTGHAAAALSRDRMATIDCKLGVYDTAAESLARATVARKRQGTVPSIAERKLTLRARRAVRQKLNDREIRAAIRKAEVEE